VSAFTVRASSLPRARREADPGRRSRDEGSLQPLTRRLWARREPPARPLRSFAPPGGPFRDDPSPWPGWAARRCSPGVLSLQSLLHLGSGSGLSQRRTLEGKALARTPPGTRSSRLHSARRTPTRGSRALGPSVSRSIEPRGPPSSDCTAHSAFVERRVRQQPASPSSCRTLGRSVLLVPPLRRHPAPSCPWRSDPIAGTHGRWTSKTLVWNRAPGPAPREAGWRSTPSRRSIRPPDRPRPPCGERALSSRPRDS